MKRGGVKAFLLINNITGMRILTTTKLVRLYTMPHSVSDQRISLFKDTFTIITTKHKETSVVNGSVALVQPEKVFPVRYSGRRRKCEPTKTLNRKV